VAVGSRLVSPALCAGAVAGVKRTDSAATPGNDPEAVATVADPAEAVAEIP